MRFRVYGCAWALAACFLAACDTTPRVENVAPGPDATTTTTPAGQRNDGMITTTVQSKYFISGDVKAHRIDVDTNEASSR